MQTLTTTKTKGITNTKLAIATLAALAAGGMAFIVFPSVRMKQIKNNNYPVINKKALQSATLITTSSITVMKDAVLTDSIINAGQTSQKLGQYVLAVSGQENVQIDSIRFFILPATSTTATISLSNLVVKREGTNIILASTSIVPTNGLAPFTFPVSLLIKANTKVSLGIYVDPLPVAWGSLSTRVPAGGVTAIGKTSGQTISGPQYYVDGQTMMVK